MTIGPGNEAGCAAIYRMTLANANRPVRVPRRWIASATTTFALRPLGSKLIFDSVEDNLEDRREPIHDLTYFNLTTRTYLKTFK